MFYKNLLENDSKNFKSFMPVDNAKIPVSISVQRNSVDPRKILTTKTSETFSVKGSIGYLVKPFTNMHFLETVLDGRLCWQTEPFLGLFVTSFCC